MLKNDKLDIWFDFSKKIFLKILENFSVEEKNNLEKTKEWYNQLESELTNYHNFEKRQKLINSINLDNEWLKFTKKTNKYHSKKIVLNYFRKIAAVTLPLFIICSVVFVLVYNVEKNTTKQIVTSSINPGTQAAKLILSNGRVLHLNNSKKIISENNGAEIKCENTSLIYNNTNSTSKEVFNVLKTGKGQEYKVTLSDGTKVWLNAESSIKYPINFIKNERLVEIEGEAYFDVNHNKKRPFCVKVKNAYTIKVLGTSFNVNAYKDNAISTTTLVKGSIEVTNNSHIKMRIKPNQQFLMNNKGEVKVNYVNTKYYTAWKEGYFYFKNETIQQIMQKLARWYNIKVFYYNNIVKKKIFSGKVKRFSNIETILNMLTKTTNIKFEIKGNVIIIK